MSALTIQEVAAELGVNGFCIHSWAKRGCSALSGQRIPVRKEKRKYRNTLTGSWSHRDVKVVPADIVAQIKQRRAEQAIPADWISHGDALVLYPRITTG